MDGVELLPEEIASALDRGATVVTGNQRAARTLRHAFDLSKRKLGLPVWLPADAMAWDAWTEALWKQLLTGGHTAQLLMNQAQEHAIWRDVLAADAELSSLRTTESLSEMAARAWRLLCSYNGQPLLRGMAVSSDTRAFERWVLAFHKRCRNEGLLTQAELEETLRAALQAGLLKTPAQEILLVGFDALTPAQAGLAEAVRAQGCTVNEVHTAVPEERRSLAAAADKTEEVYTAARWIRQHIEEHPAAQIAVILPSLDSRRAEIDSIFREVLSLEMEDIAAPNDGVPYEFSLGTELARTPMAGAALNLLRWALGPLPLESVSNLLLSPYFAMQPEDIGPRAEFDAFELRKAKMLRPEITLDWLSSALARSRRKLGGLSGMLHTMRIVAAGRLSGAGRLSHAAWAERMREFLLAAHWGAHAEDGIEFQTRRKWEGALDELATLDFDGSRVAFGQALESLDRIAQRTLFAPESRRAPVQIMGPLEAAGGTFDAVWFLDASDLTWPPQAGSNPLLPWRLQRDLLMPGTDVALDAEHAHRMTQRIAASAPIAIFSYAMQSAEGPRRPASALKELGLEEVRASAVVPAETKREPIAVERAEDAAPLPSLPGGTIHGGAEILRLQAACGFRAFAERRLWASIVRVKAMGMDAAERGTVVHLVLERFWDEVQSQSKLKAMSSAEWRALLDRCISGVLEKSARLSSTPWDAAYLEMQHERLCGLLGLWIERELERPPFTVILREKYLKDAQIGPLRLNVRVDRIDTGEDGEIIIDYKTGAAKPSDWLSDRPDAPQLPLYAVLSNAKKLEGVAFGHVRAGKDMGLHGFAAHPGTGIRTPRSHPENLEDQVEEWQRVLTSLAEDFCHGDARVDPKAYPATCAYCAQRPLCRLDVASFEEEMDDGGAAEAERD